MAEHALPESIEGSVSLEPDLRSYLATRVSEIESGLTLVESGVEYQTEAGKIDLLARDSSKQLVVIELKAGKGKRYPCNIETLSDKIFSLSLVPRLPILTLTRIIYASRVRLINPHAVSLSHRINLSSRKATQMKKSIAVIGALLTSVLLGSGTLAQPVKQQAKSSKLVPLTILQSSDRILEQGYTKKAIAAALPSDSKVYALGSDKLLYVHDRQKGSGKTEPRVSVEDVRALAIGPDANIYIATAESTLRVVNPSGGILRGFPIFMPTSIDVLTNGNVVVASLVNGKLLHLYNSQGHLLRSFGEMKDFGYGYKENAFLNRGKIVVGTSDSLYYVFTHSPEPTIMRFSRGGDLLGQFAVEGAAIDAQLEIARRFLERRTRDKIGGFLTITSASVDPKTGHLWVSLLGLSSAGVVYEYSSGGEKLREYSFLISTPGGAAAMITGAEDIIVRNGTIYLINYGRVYRFALESAALRQPSRCLTTLLGSCDEQQAFERRTDFAQANFRFLPRLNPLMPQSPGCPPTDLEWLYC